MTESPQFWQIVSVVLFVCVVYAGERILHFWMKAKELKSMDFSKFQLIHGFMNQEVVDFRLRQLAAEFSKAVDRQGEALKPGSNASIGVAQLDVETAKKAFWDVQAGVRRWTDCKVDDSIKPYLPTPLRPVR